MGYSPNKKNLRERSDYGVRVARPGYDANNCAQNQLLFNSNWPILQIASVIKMDNFTNESVYEYRVTTTVINTDTWEQISGSDVTTYPSEPPAGYTSTNTFYFDPYEYGIDYRLIEVNRKFVRKPLAGDRTSYIYPNETHTEGNIRTTITKTCVLTPYAKKQHRLGFVPFFMMSADISDVSGYIVLFSVDISKDVDYPYTEQALALLSPATDYGIKSSSKFGSRVPGLCSNMFSKLVQAVKTEETSTRYNDDLRSIWSPVKSAEEAKGGELLPYEFYSFIGNSDSNAGIDGGAYYARDYPFYMSRYNGASLVDAWAVSTTSFQSWVSTKNSLIVLRSPMVSPEYEERTLS